MITMSNSLLMATDPKYFHAHPTCFSFAARNFQLFLFKPCNPNFFFTRLPFPKSKSNVITGCSRKSHSLPLGSTDVGSNDEEAILLQSKGSPSNWNVQVGNPILPTIVSPLSKSTLSDKASFLLLFIACMTSVAFTSLVVASIPTLHAMRRAAISLSNLADVAREELPSTMAAIRLSGMEISDLTLELSDLSQEIADGVDKSAQAVQAAESGIRQIGYLARKQTESMIQERAKLPKISLQPVVAGAAKQTSRAVGRATKTFINFISGADPTPENEHYDSDRIEV